MSSIHFCCFFTLLRPQLALLFKREHTLQDRSDVCVFSILWPAQTLNKRDLFSFSRLVGETRDQRGKSITQKPRESTVCACVRLCRIYWYDSVEFHSLNRGSRGQQRLLHRVGRGSFFLVHTLAECHLAVEQAYCLPFLVFLPRAKYRSDIIKMNTTSCTLNPSFSS